MNMRLYQAATFIFLVLVTLPGVDAAACTSFSMDTPDGPLYGTNCDLLIPGDGLVFVNRRGLAKEGYDANTAGDPLEWVARYGSVTFNLAGRELAWGGINEAGLVMSSMQLTASKCPKPDARFPMGAGLLVQYLLDTCGTIDEVIDALKPIRPPESECDSHFLVMDATGNTLAIEYLDRKLVTYSGADLPVRAMANIRYDRAAVAYERGGPRWWWSNPGASAQRVAGAEDRLRNFDAARDTCAVTYAFETLTHVVAAPHTKWNIVIDPTLKKIWFRSARSPSIKFLTLDACDFSCDSPVMMLDLNADLEGDVGGSFIPFDHEVNKELFQVFCSRWGIKVSEEGAVALMELFEGFECAGSGSETSLSE
jgi:penicillin V acylase-like amidase (Ntn superfamily)